MSTYPHIGFTIPDSEWLTANGRYGHHMALAARTRALRERAALIARAAINTGQLHPYTRVPLLIAAIGYPTASRADPTNAAPTVKALIDGCTTAGLWKDDNSDVLPLIAFGRSNTKAPKHTHLVILYLTDLEINYQGENQ